MEDIKYYPALPIEITAKDLKGQIVALDPCNVTVSAGTEYGTFRCSWYQRYGNCMARTFVYEDKLTAKGRDVAEYLLGYLASEVRTVRQSEERIVRTFAHELDECTRLQESIDALLPAVQEAKKKLQNKELTDREYKAVKRGRQRLKDQLAKTQFDYVQNILGHPNYGYGQWHEVFHKIYLNSKNK